MHKLFKLDKNGDSALINMLSSNKIEDRIKVKIALQAFVSEPLRKVQKKIQAIGVSTDFEQLTKDAYNVSVEEDNFDLGYERAFRNVQLGKGQDSWQMYNVTNGISFNKVEEGQRIELNGLTGAVTTSYVDYYGGALGFTDKMIRFRKIPVMLDLAMLFRNKFWSNKADNHYTLIAAATGTALAWQGAAADGQVRRDIQTINVAAFNLGNALKDKGYGDMATAPFVIYANPYDESRIEAAFKAITQGLTGALGAAQEVTRRRIDRVYTYNSNIVAGAPVILLPGNKLQKATAMEPTTYTNPQDILTLNYAQSVWGIYGAAIGDTDQVAKFTLGS